MSTISRTRLCWCGSGRTPEACHDLPKRERRRHQRELDVLGEANDLAALFPSVRPRDRVFTGYADRVAAAIEPNGASVPTHVVEEGMAILDAPERGRIVHSWCDPYPDRWESLIADGGEEALIRRAVVAGAVRVAILERLPLERDAVYMYESGLFSDVPANALTLLVPPSSIWSIDEALVASEMFPAAPQFEPARFDALERYGQNCVTDMQCARLQEAAERIARQLPVTGLPTASRTLAAACGVIAADEGWCAAIAARQLALYAGALSARRRW